MTRWAWLLIVAVSITLIGGFWVFFERHSYTIEQGYSAKARANPFLAAHRFVQQIGVELVEGRSSVDFPSISSADAIFLSDLDQMVFTELKITQSLAWVASGGHLIAGVGAEVAGANSLLYLLDVEPTVVESSQKDDLIDGLARAQNSDQRISDRLREYNQQLDEKNRKPAGDAPNDTEQEGQLDEILDLLQIDRERETMVLSLDGEVGEITLEVLDNIALKHPDTEFVAPADGSLGEPRVATTPTLDYQLGAYVYDSQGPRLLQFSYGNGTITLLSSATLWTNQEIGRVDNAYFLAYLVEGLDKLHFFYNVSAPSLVSLLRKYFAELLLAVTLLVLFCLWRASMRVEVMRQRNNSQRREFNEHLIASAEFLAKHQQFRTLLRSVEHEIVRKMRKHHPNFSQLGRSTQAGFLAEQASIPESTAQQWLGYVERMSSLADFNNALILGTQIRNKL